MHKFVKKKRANNEISTHNWIYFNNRNTILCTNLKKKKKKSKQWNKHTQLMYVVSKLSYIYMTIDTLLGASLWSRMALLSLWDTVELNFVPVVTIIRQSEMTEAHSLGCTCEVITLFFIVTHVWCHGCTVMSYIILSRNSQEYFNKFLCPDPDHNRGGLWHMYTPSSKKIKSIRAVVF